MRLGSIHTWPAPREENSRIVKKVEHAIVNDYHCVKIGYGNDGNPIFIKPSDAQLLYKILKGEYGN